MEATDAKRNHNQLRRAARVRPPAPLPGGLGGAGGWAVGWGLCGVVGDGLAGLPCKVEDFHSSVYSESGSNAQSGLIAASHQGRHLPALCRVLGWVCCSLIRPGFQAVH